MRISQQQKGGERADAHCSLRHRGGAQPATLFSHPSVAGPLYKGTLSLEPQFDYSSMSQTADAGTLQSQQRRCDPLSQPPKGPEF